MIHIYSRALVCLCFGCLFLLSQISSVGGASSSRKFGGWFTFWEKPKETHDSIYTHRRHVADIPFLVNKAGSKPKVSKIIHQSWKTDKTDPSVKEWQDSWKDLNPDWTYILWTDEMNRKLVERHYPWFLETYDGFPEAAAGILRADSVRYMYLHHYGGVYADLDFRALKPMDELFGKSEHLALAGRISDQDEDDTWENNVPNAWMASALPGHPLWLNCLIQVMKQAAVLNCQGPSCFIAEAFGLAHSTAIARAYYKEYNIEKTTGPMLFRSTVIEWQRQGRHPKFRVELLPAGWIYPIDWRKMYDQDHVCYKWHERSESLCYKQFPDAYTITYWSHIWDIHHRDDNDEED